MATVQDVQIDEMWAQRGSSKDTRNMRRSCKDTHNTAGFNNKKVHDVRANNRQRGKETSPNIRIVNHERAIPYEQPVETTGMQLAWIVLNGGVDKVRK